MSNDAFAVRYTNIHHYSVYYLFLSRPDGGSRTRSFSVVQQSSRALSVQKKSELDACPSPEVQDSHGCKTAVKIEPQHNDRSKLEPSRSKIQIINGAYKILSMTKPYH